MNGQPPTLVAVTNVTTSIPVTMATITMAPITMVPTSGMQSVMSELPTPPQAHQHPNTLSNPALTPPAAHQVMSTSPQLLSSPSSTPGLSLSPARHSPSPRSPAPGSPVGSTLALIYPGGGPIPLTVSHSSPVGKHGGTLGALTASVNALQRPISTAGLHSHTTMSYPVVRTTLAPTSRVTAIPYTPITGPRGTRSPKHKMIMTTKTSIFNRSHTITSTPRVGPPVSVVTIPPGMVRVSPSTQAVRAQMQAQVQAQAQAQAHMKAIQQVRQIFPQATVSIPPQSPPMALRASSGPLMRSPSPSSPNINSAQAKLQQALANAAAKYRSQQQRFAPVSPISSPPPMGLVAPSVQQRSKHKTIPNPPAMSQAIKPAPHIPILPKSSPIPGYTPGYTHIMPKPVNMKIDATSKKPRSNEDKKPTPTKSGSQFKPLKGHGSQRAKKSAGSIPTATVSATATIPHKVKVVAGKEMTDSSSSRQDMNIRPGASVRPGLSVRPEIAVRPDISGRSEVNVRSEVTVTSDVVTIKENGCIEKEVPRAIVRPQVLTHVIDGFIIEESKEPFPVSHTSEMSDAIPEQQQPTPHKHQHKERKQHKPKQSKKDSGDALEEGNMLRCEFCGKTAPARNFTRSKRFCSLPCAKRYNVGCSKKLGLFSPKRENPEKAKHTLKLQTKAKPLKGVRGKHGRLSFNVGQPFGPRFNYTDDKSWNKPPATVPPKQTHQHPLHHQQLQRTDSTTSSSSSSNDQSASEETSSGGRAPSPSQVSEPDTTPAGSDDAFEDAPPTSNPDPAKWTVQDVFEFIRALPGCESYADEFQRQEIDGQALLLLKEDHLMTAMNMKLGPALKIINRINSLKKGN